MVISRLSKVNVWQHSDRKQLNRLSGPRPSGLRLMIVGSITINVVFKVYAMVGQENLHSKCSDHL